MVQKVGEQRRNVRWDDSEMWRMWEEGGVSRRSLNTRSRWDGRMQGLAPFSMVRSDSSLLTAGQNWPTRQTRKMGLRLSTELCARLSTVYTAAVAVSLSKDMLHRRAKVRPFCSLASQTPWQFKAFISNIYRHTKCFDGLEMMRPSTE